MMIIVGKIPNNIIFGGTRVLSELYTFLIVRNAWMINQTVRPVRTGFAVLRVGSDAELFNARKKNKRVAPVVNTKTSETYSGRCSIIMCVFGKMKRCLPEKVRFEVVILKWRARVKVIKISNTVENEKLWQYNLERQRYRQQQHACRINCWYAGCCCKFLHFF